jgi:hypothetical protein
MRGFFATAHELKRADLTQGREALFNPLFNLGR